MYIGRDNNYNLSDMEANGAIYAFIINSIISFR